MSTPTVTNVRRLTLTQKSAQSHLLDGTASTPRDKFNLVTIAMFALGTGTMLAESMLLSIGTYYKREYPDYPFLVYLVLPAYAFPNLIFLLIMTGT